MGLRDLINARIPEADLDDRGWGAPVVRRDVRQSLAALKDLVEGEAA
jgi:hypothetical protein